jgi:hypothetical protein
MAYQVDRFNGTFFVSVADGTIDTTTDIRLVGKNYAGYGEVQNENFLHMLENFANTSPPPKAVSGQIWYDSANKKLRFYDGSRFKFASGAEYSTSAPTGLTPGDFWFDANSNQLKAWNGSDFILIGPEAAPEFGTSAAVGQVVQDNTGNPRAIVKLVSGDQTIAITSSNEFTLGSANPISGFTRIKKGITLVNTDASTGVTSSTTEHYFWGTASNALRLGGELATQYVRKNDLNFNQLVAFVDAGFQLGNDGDLNLFVETEDPFGINELRDEDQLVIYQTQPGQPITFRQQINEISSTNILKIRSTSIEPGADGATSLGLPSKRFSTVNSLTFVGDLNGNVTGNVIGSVKGNILASDDTVAFDFQTKTFFGSIGTPSQRTLVYGDLIGDVTGKSATADRLGTFDPSIGTSAQTVVVRDSSGNINATGFLGTATFADRIKIASDATTDSDPNYKSAKRGPVPDSIAARTGDGDLFARLFDGTATAARYADLAEKYLADKEYESGTVVTVGGEKEVTACQEGNKVLGVVSTNPAFMMNKDLEGGTYIALKGRVPVKVIGSVVKGQGLIAGHNGTAVAVSSNTVGIFAIALESNDTYETKYVESVIL